MAHTLFPRRLLKGALAVSSALVFSISAPVHAQQDQASEAQEIEEITVTGTRIRRTNLISTSPVTQVDADEFLYGGITRVEDLLNDLPQMSGGVQQTGTSNGGTGVAAIDLRGLGTQRTLTLLNGRRLPPGSPTSTDSLGADVNQIPAIMIERVEVLTGGASAAYGSDAIAGVVNFITKSDFQGLQFDYQFSQYQHENDNSAIQQVVTDAGFEAATGSVTDGDTHDFALMFGVGSEDGRGNFTAYATYRDIEEIRQGSRDYSSCALGDGPNTDAGTFTCGGSQTMPQGSFSDFATIDFIVEGDQFVPRNGLLYNFGPENFYQRPDERTTLGGFGSYRWNDRAEAYLELSFMDDRSLTQIAPSGAFFVTDTIQCGNPFLSAQQFQVLCGDFGLTVDDAQDVFLGRRNVEGGSRQQDLRHTSYRGVLGLRGDINETWNYDAFMNFGTVVHSNVYLNDLGTTKVLRALDAVLDERLDEDGLPLDPETFGQPVCRSVVDGSDPACVPWNVFEEGAVTQDMIDYLTLPLFAKGETSQTQLSGYVSGDLADYGIQLPTAENGVQAAFGYEYRKEALEFEPDDGFQAGEGAGQGGATLPVSGDYDVWELFVETTVPVVEGRTGADLVSFDLGYRYSDYSTGHQTDTYKIAGEWAVVDDIRFRGSFQRAVRAANLRELFLPEGFNLFDMDQDPCGPNPTATAEQCANSGVTAAQYGALPHSPAGQYNFLQGGNPDLVPEESDTVSFGFIFNPRFLPDLTLTVDYYDIDVQGAIDNLDPEFTLDTCHATGDPQFCDFIHRDPGTGALWLADGNVEATNVNIGFLNTAGFDISADYDLEIGQMGSLHFALVGTLLDKWDEQNSPAAETVDCVGNWGSTCGAPIPEWRAGFRTTWVTPWDGTISMNWRHLGEAKDLGVNQNHFDAQNYVDLAALWPLMDDLVTLRVGISNITDEDPPLSGDAGPSFYGNGNSFPGAYDVLGRYMFGGFSVTF